MCARVPHKQTSKANGFQTKPVLAYEWEARDDGEGVPENSKTSPCCFSMDSANSLIMSPCSESEHCGLSVCEAYCTQHLEPHACVTTSVGGGELSLQCARQCLSIDVLEQRCKIVQRGHSSVLMGILFRPGDIVLRGQDGLELGISWRPCFIFPTICGVGGQPIKSSVRRNNCRVK